MHYSGTWRLVSRMPKAKFRRLVVSGIEKTIKGIYSVACMTFSLLAAMMLMELLFRLAGVAG